MCPVREATYLRHGSADLKEVKETLGRSSITLTSGTYISVLEMQDKTADASAELIPRRNTGRPATGTTRRHVDT